MAHNSQPTETSVAAVSAWTTTNSVIIHHAQPVIIVQGQAGCGCDCSAPPNASLAVEGTRWSSIAIIIIHAIALLLLGFLLLGQWIASLIGIIMGSILLCNFKTCCYITAVVLYSIGIAFDVVTAIYWLHYGYGFWAMPPIVGAIAFLTGAITGSIVIYQWEGRSQVVGVLTV